MGGSTSQLRKPGVVTETGDPVVQRHCDLLDQAWQLLTHAWDGEADKEWRAGARRWRDAYFALWAEHCGHDPGPAPYGLPVIKSAAGSVPEVCVLAPIPKRTDR